MATLAIATALVGSVQAQQREAPKKAAEPAKEKSETADRNDAAAAVGAPVDPNSYEIGPEDVIFVEVWHDNDFTRAHVVRPDGKISMQLVGEIQAAGQTPVNLAKAIAAKLSTIIRDPQVDVSVRQVRSKRYYIQGEVNNPGTFPLVVPTRILEALTNSGGFKEFANTKRIIILRQGKQLRFNYNEVIRGKKMEQNVLLESGDYIIVR
jgi:polysaccharide export outer membrane protein